MKQKLAVTTTGKSTRAVNGLAQDKPPQVHAITLQANRFNYTQTSELLWGFSAYSTQPVLRCLPVSVLTVKDPPAEDSQAYCSSSLCLVITVTFSATK